MRASGLGTGAGQEMNVDREREGGSKVERHQTQPGIVGRHLYLGASGPTQFLINSAHLLIIAHLIQS